MTLGMPEDRGGRPDELGREGVATMQMDHDMGIAPFVPITAEDRAPQAAVDPVYVCGEYDGDGNLVRATKRYPLPECGQDSPQKVADSVGSQKTLHGSSTVLVWEDENTVAPAMLADAPAAQGRFVRAA